MLWQTIIPFPQLYSDLDAIIKVATPFTPEEGYPHAMRQKLHEAGLPNLLAEAPAQIDAALAGNKTTSSVSMWHGCALNHYLASIDNSLAISVGVNYLGLVPIYMAGSAEQIKTISQKVHSGAYAALALTEIAHGSNLLANQTVARPHGDFYCISGEKQLINGGSQHEIITTIAHTGGQASTALSLFLIDRDGSVSTPRTWPTLPMPDADIASIRFDRTPANLLGRKGRGFATIQKMLTLTRGGISAWAAGVTNRAVVLSAEYAHTRHVKQAPMLHLNPIADHLLEMQSLDLLVSSLSIKAIAMLNRYGPAASMIASAAKVVCCQLAEQAVTEGRILHGARALLQDFPYHTLVRDVILYGTFDGTTHIVLDQLQMRLAQLVVQPEISTPLHPIIHEAYSHPPSSWLRMCRHSARPLFVHPVKYLRELAGIGDGAQAATLLEVAQTLFTTIIQTRKSGEWDADQSLRLKLAQLYGLLEALIAVVELTDPVYRSSLGMAPLEADAAPQQLLIDYTLTRWAGRLLTELATISDRPDAIQQQITHLLREARKQRNNILNYREAFLIH